MKHPNWKLKQWLELNLMISNIISTSLKWKYHSPHQKTFFMFWATIFWSRQMATSKITLKYSHASQFTKNKSSLNLEEYTLLQNKIWWDVIRSAFSNPDQQTTSDQHTNHSKIKTTLSHNCFSHLTLVQSQKQQEKFIRNYQEPFAFALSNIQQ